MNANAIIEKLCLECTSYTYKSANGHLIMKLVRLMLGAHRIILRKDNDIRGRGA